MAKVLISLPDELLARADNKVRDSGATRSGYIQQLIRDDLAAADEARRAAIERLLSHARPMGGNAAELIRRDRRSH